MAHKDSSVATVLGWKCCCDIELQSLADGSMSGSGFSGKKNTGVKFDISCYRANEGSRISVVISSEGRELDLSGVSESRSDVFTLDAGDFFGDHDALDLGIPRSRLVVLIGQHTELKRSFRNSAFGLTYMPPVWELFRHSPPSSIFEWGPGRSTLFFAELFPEAEIRGVEHNRRWFANCAQIMEEFGARVQIEHRHLEISPAKAEPYVTHPLWNPDKKYDLVFIDGRLRCDCAVIAKQILSENGIVMVHDAHRKVYQPAYQLYPGCEVAYNTAFLSSRKDTIAGLLQDR
ncbi:MAG: hypothetical protein P1V20_16760 [Verrucomicrobiales bacterium]|nr:hypothetical protein [Verrucomicrobiales bacterium]